MVTIQYLIYTLTIDDGVWRGDAPGTVALLNSLMSAGGPSGSDPDPDYTAALGALGVLGRSARIIRVDRPAKSKPGRIQ